MVRHDGTWCRAGCTVSGITQCPAGYSLPTFGAFTTAPNNLTITNCFKDGSVASCSFINVVSGAVQSGAQGTYPTPILNSNNATIGCLQSNVPSCPSSAPFPLISYTPSGTSSRGTILSCSVALTSCNSTLIPAMTQGTLSACISFTANPAGGTTQFKCPSDYPVVVTNIDNPANVDAVSEILMCMSASSTCLASAPTSSPFTVTTSNTPSPQAFCVPVTGLTSCASYPASAYQSGVPIYAPNGVSLIGCTDVKTCPAPFFPVFFLDSSQPPNTVRCQASVAGSCPSAYPLPIIGANGALAGCSALSTNCTTGVIVAENATTSETVTCLAPGTTSCPAGTYSFPIYSGTRDANTGGATLVRCIRDPAAPDCNGAALSTYNIEVYGPTGTNVIGCVQASSAGTSYCPFGQPVAHMSQGSGTPTPFTLYQCRPAGSSCGAADSGLNFTIPIRNVPQINNAIVGCLASTATTCPGADGTVQIPNAGSAPLFAPFFVLGSGTPSLVECRQVASPPALPGPGTTCTQFLGPSTIYTIATTNAAGDLAGCSSPGAACASGFLPQYSDAGVPTSTCVASTCSGTANKRLYNTAGVQVGCGTDNTCTGGTGPFTGGVKTFASGGTATYTGCMAIGATACPSSLGPAVFTLWAEPGSNADKTFPVLSQCWVDAGGAQTCAALTLPAIAAGGYVEVSATSGSITTNAVPNPNPLRGCTPFATAARRLCPAAAPYFIVAAGAAPWNLAGGDRCLINAPSTCSPSKVPIVDTSSSTSATPVIGCIAATATLASLSGCPAADLLPVNGTFNYPIATATAFPDAIVPANAIAVGDVIRCIRPTTTCANPSVPVGSATAPPTACLVNVNGITCPASGATASASPSNIVAFYGPTSSSDATAKLELCGPQPVNGVPAAVVLCSSSTSAPYSVPVNNLAFTATPATPPTTQIACAKPLTACPASTFPVIDATNTITECRTNVPAGTPTQCPANYVPLCDSGTDAATNNDGTCTEGNIRGCTLFGGATAATTTCAAATANKYPVATGYPIFVVALNAQQGAAPTTKSCYTSAATKCGKTVAAPTTIVFTVRASTGSTLNGCTNVGEGSCSAWWQPPKTCVTQTA